MPGVESVKTFCALSLYVRERAKQTLQGLHTKGSLNCTVRNVHNSVMVPNANNTNNTAGWSH